MTLQIKQRSDSLGAAASLFCIIHCAATPFVFVAQTYAATCSEFSPLWWQIIDYLFLVISFAAIYETTKRTSLNWIRPCFWVCWTVLLLVIINEKFTLISIVGAIKYLPAFLLVLLHLYNQRNTVDNCAV